MCERDNILGSGQTKEMSFSEFGCYPVNKSDNNTYSQGYYNLNNHHMEPSEPSGNSYHFQNGDGITNITQYNTDIQNKLPKEKMKTTKVEGKVTRGNAARERNRVQTLRSAFLDLQRCLPAVPLDTKLSKLDVLVLATTYIGHLTWTLQGDGQVQRDPCKMTQPGGVTNIISKPAPAKEFLHPVKKWPMRSRLYAGIAGLPDCNITKKPPLNTISANKPTPSIGQQRKRQRFIQN